MTIAHDAGTRRKNIMVRNRNNRKNNVLAAIEYIVDIKIST
jgi:hypothetical protein